MAPSLCSGVIPNGANEGPGTPELGVRAPQEVRGGQCTPPPGPSVQLAPGTTHLSWSSPPSGRAAAGRGSFGRAYLQEGVRAGAREQLSPAAQCPGAQKAKVGSRKWGRRRGPRPPESLCLLGPAPSRSAAAKAEPPRKAGAPARGPGRPGDTPPLRTPATQRDVRGAWAGRSLGLVRHGGVGGD